jgi:hypothetical protein
MLKAQSLTLVWRTWIRENVILIIYTYLPFHIAILKLGSSFSALNIL